MIAPENVKPRQTTPQYRHIFPHDTRTAETFLSATSALLAFVDKWNARVMAGRPIGASAQKGKCYEVEIDQHEHESEYAVAIIRPRGSYGFNNKSILIYRGREIYAHNGELLKGDFYPSEV